MTLAIRQYGGSDLEACRDLWRDLTQRHRDIYDDQSIGGEDPGLEFDEHLRKRSIVGTWVAEQSAEIVGFVSLLVEGKEGEIDPIVVKSESRSRGIGKQLLDLMIEEARRRDVRSLSIRPVARNVEAMALYHEMGFRNLGHIDMFMDLQGGTEWKYSIEIHGRKYGY